MHEKIQMTFEEWLVQQEYAANTIASQLARIDRIRRAYPDLDKQFEHDAITQLQDEFAYTRQDFREGRPNPTRLPIDGDVYHGLATYRATLRRYMRYKECSEKIPQPHPQPSHKPSSGFENLDDLTITELLSAYSSVIDELKRRGVVRSKNNPTGDYAEWLASSGLGLTLAQKSAKGFDATDSEGLRYQIKGRQNTPDNPSTQLGVIRNLDTCDFDFLIAIVFSADWQILRAAKIPHGVVSKLATFRKYQNGHIMHMRHSVLTEPGVENITGLLLAVSQRMSEV